ncbi:MAG: polysaccharide biosynthesis C-terminal domain-containing protein, partial [Candidatus Falkowbacteria bacterium]|nr:polysaccharide biosynthesis C-terminal domain-containing protein [Candidatus Falkowbacteria bacterium]
RKFGVKILPLYDFTLIKSLAYISLSFAVFAIFNKLYTYLDSVLLQFFAGDAAVGLYQIAFKIMFAIQFLPAAFTASLYPAFSHYWTNNRSQLTITFERAMIYLIIISLPIAVGIATIADKLIIVFKDSFKDAVVPLEIAMISLVFIFLNYPVGALLNACDKQKENTKFMGIVLVVNVILNLILIPRLGVSGACITVVITNILMFVLGMSVVHKIIDYNKVKLLLVFLKSFFASLVMGSLVIYLKEGMNIFAVVILAVSVYFVLVLSMGAVKKQDFNSIIKSFKKV